MSKQNCWEAKRCGRQPGGEKVPELGACPAATDETSQGMNGGQNGGRICWAVSGTLCGGEVQGTYAQKATSCLTCAFYSQVKQEEGGAFMIKAPHHSHA
jgi:hypothetical protein